MLESLHLKNVGPAPDIELTFAPRLNLITGDNGLGKSFLLDVAWWALTRKWPHDLNGRLTSGYAAKPVNPKQAASISFQVKGKSGKLSTYQSTYARKDEAWLGKPGRPSNPGLVLYAHSDGGFSVWDPARNYWRTKGNADVQDRPGGYALSVHEVWNGLPIRIDGKDTTVCRGLIEDLSIWLRENGKTAERMAFILRKLAAKGESIQFGPLTRLSVSDARDIPTIKTSYGHTVPIVHASSGLKRVIGLAYMLMWCWDEHVRASKLLGQAPTRRLVMLFDEIESHLHPKWQRTILDSVLGVTEIMHKAVSIQLLAVTHSPLVLASAEPSFDAKKDAWFDMDLNPETSRVEVRHRPFVPRGEVSSWLTSDAFDLKNARSVQAEEAIEAALLLLRTARRTRAQIIAADKKLREARLPDIDPFWVRWGQFLEQHGVSR